MYVYGSLNERQKQVKMEMTVKVGYNGDTQNGKLFLEDLM